MTRLCQNTHFAEGKLTTLIFSSPMNSDTPEITRMSDRFRGFLPVIVDVETGGFNAETDALLEIAATLVEMNEQGELVVGETYCRHVLPFDGANLDPKALEFNGITDPFNPLRDALSEQDALKFIFEPVRKAVKQQDCQRAILVGHNAFFDLGFINAAVRRTGIKRNPFHPFSTFDTVTLSGVALGQTVLAKAARAAGMAWDGKAAHTAAYDANGTAELFCRLVNAWKTYPQATAGATQPAS